VADPVRGSLTDGQFRVLVAIVEGYRAREGMKDRIRALNEWEIARRAGGTTLSYAEFTQDAAREDLVRVLGELQGLGLVSIWERGVHYDTFIPTQDGDRLVDLSKTNDAAASTALRSAGLADLPAADPVVERLDEIIRLLNSIQDRLPPGH